jgi:hypothetical protein
VVKKETIIPKGLSDHTLQGLKYLLKNPYFEKEVLKLKKKFNIPAEGFKTQIEQVYFLLLMNGRKIIRKSNGRSCKREQKVTPRIRQLNSEIKRLRLKYGLPERFYYTLLIYLLNNNWSKLCEASIAGSSVHIRKLTEEDEPKLVVEIFGDTTKKDYVKAWETIEVMKKSMILPGKFNTTKYINFFRDRLIYDLSKEEGVPNLKMYDKVKEITGIDAKELMDPGYVKMRRQRYKKTLKEGIT